jgi:uncharacterized protein with HEPN domain
VPSEKPLGRLEDILANIVRVERFTAGMDFDRNECPYHTKT